MADQHDDGATADAAVEAILRTLDGVRDAPTADHPAIYARLHDQLLAELDADPDSRAPGTGPVPGPRPGA
ncbi:MAG TPA: hypothetical protein VGN49_03505 [Micrococcaceae bacterium]|jgi:phytoene/squalene synthetase|nr:hypothetical protein [Micrococcaceae bacterium]